MKHPFKMLFSVVAILGLAYGVRTIHYTNHFLRDTVINGVQVGGKTVDEATAALKTELDEQRYTVTEDKHTLTTFTSREAGIRQPSQADIKTTLKNQNQFAWPMHLSTANASSHGFSLAGIDRTKLKQLAQNLVTTANQTPRIATKNAQLAYQNGRFIIVKPVYGTEVNVKTATKALTKALETNQQTFDLKQAYVKPAIKTDNPKLQVAKVAADNIASHQLSFRIAGKTQRVAKKRVASWLTTRNGTLTLKPKQVTTFLSALSKKYGTISKKRRFKATGGHIVTVPAGLYGWSVNVSASMKKIKPLILKNMQKRDILTTPVIQGTGYHKDGTDIGKTYVEVSKARQHMWIYKKGKLVISTAVVTGKPVKGTTPSGVYLVWNKQRNATLRGRNDNGSKYASKVSYWMPVDNTGVGIHDSPWQPKYGGTWYIRHGSHGCINTPPSVMARVYATVARNTPVIIY